LYTSISRPVAQRGLVGIGDQHRMIGARLGLDIGAESGGDRPRQRRPVMGGVGMVQRQLACALGRRPVIDRDPGAVRTAIGHRREHRGDMPAQLRSQGGVLEEKTDDAAHGGEPFAWNVARARTPEEYSRGAPT
jgi:hypothetical protein